MVAMCLPVDSSSQGRENWKCFTVEINYFFSVNVFDVGLLLY